MSVVVERGLARCPRCVAVADYTFVESGPNSVRYEVRCAKCGEAYSEVNTPVAPDISAAILASAVPLPTVSTGVVGAVRQRIRTYVARSRPDWSKMVHRRRPPEPPV